MRKAPFVKLNTKFFAVLVTTMLALTAAAIPAAANIITNAQANSSCTGYTLNLSAKDLKVGTVYKITWQINGLPEVVNDQIMFTATATSFSGKVTKTWANYGITLAGSYSLSGTATLVGHNSVAIAFSPSALTCPAQCSAQTTNTSNFNGTSISANSYIWFNANFSASGIPSTGATVFFQGSSIQFTANQSYNLPVPNAEITFSPTATCTSYSFDTATNTWQTITPVKVDDEIFLTGLTFPVPSGFSKVQGNVTWLGTMSSDVPGVSMQWKWGAAVYTTYSANYNTLAVKPGHQTSCSYNNGDHAGTPEGIDPISSEPFKDFVIGGARGGGGSNWTGSWSGTTSAQCQE